DDYVEAFEVARRKDETADLGAFLPPDGDPLRHAVLGELIRIDLEYGWESGRPHPLDDYPERFPQLFSHRDCLQAAAPEQLAPAPPAGPPPPPGESPSHSGSDPPGRPPPLADTPEAPPPSVQLEQAARSYHAFRLSGTPGGSLDLRRWDADSLPASVSHLFR